MRSKYQEQAFNDLIEEAQEAAKKELKDITKNQDLLNLAAEFAEMFSTNHKRGEGERFSKIKHYYVGGVGTDLHLGKVDKSNVVHLIVDAMIRDPRLNLMGTPAKELTSTSAAWSFETKDHNSLDLTVYYEESETCTMVGTGKYTKAYEIRRLICSD